MTDQSFVFTTDVSANQVKYSNNELPEYDAYLMIYTKDGSINYSADVQNDSEHDLVMILSSLKEEIVIHDILNCLPEMLEYGEEIAEQVYSHLDVKDEIRKVYSESPLIFPVDIFRNHHSKNHGAE